MQMGKSVVPLAAHGAGAASGHIGMTGRSDGPGEPLAVPQGEARAEVRATAQRPSAAKGTRRAEGHGAFVPLLLMALTLVGAFGLQAVQRFTERQALQAAYAGQQQTVDNAGKVRASLDALAADTQRLADAGNANAALLVAELSKRGITINAAASPAPAPTATSRGR